MQNQHLGGALFQDVRKPCQATPLVRAQSLQLNHRSAQEAASPEPQRLVHFCRTKNPSPGKLSGSAFLFAPCGKAGEPSSWRTLPHCLTEEHEDPDTILQATSPEWHPFAPSTLEQGTNSLMHRGHSH
ncbi:Ferritin Light Chain [Manis pentadactyla]|nr:Ferritin Light Chain [Manis pentadactyla]